MWIIAVPSLGCFCLHVAGSRAGRGRKLASSHPGSQHVSVSAQSIPASLFSIFEEEMIILSAFLKYVYEERFERKGSVFYSIDWFNWKKIQAQSLSSGLTWKAILQPLLQTWEKDCVPKSLSAFSSCICCSNKRYHLSRWTLPHLCPSSLIATPALLQLELVFPRVNPGYSLEHH